VLSTPQWISGTPVHYEQTVRKEQAGPCGSGYLKKHDVGLGKKHADTEKHVQLSRKEQKEAGAYTRPPLSST